MDLLKNGQAEIQGMIREIREFKNRDQITVYEHIILEPAKDEYSFPRSFPVCCQKILGVKGEVVKIVADIQSWSSKGFYSIRLWAAQGG